VVGSLPWEERAAPFLRAADMLEYGSWRAKLNTATMLELSKTTYQADIDAACETVDFLRANVKNMLDMYDVQPGSKPGASTSPVRQAHSSTCGARSMRTSIATATTRAWSGRPVAKPD
jgi:acyl-CoA reductase-like NAD-dependent aldehyde dehydrogenase